MDQNHTTDKRARFAALALLLFDFFFSDEERPAASAKYYSTANPGPLETARAFADAARRGDFPSFKVRRRLTAKAEDVHAALERRVHVRRPKVTAAANDAVDDDRAILKSMGVRLTKQAGATR